MGQDDKVSSNRTMQYIERQQVILRLGIVFSLRKILIDCVVVHSSQ